MADYIRYTVEDHVATLVIDHPPVNALNSQTLMELSAALDELLADDAAKVIVVTGGGLELAMACHIRVAGDRVRLGQPEINLGIIPGWGGTQRLPRIVGASKATEMILTGDQITAQQALQLRLVNLVVPGGEVMRQAKGLAHKIADKSAVTVSAALTAIGAGLDGGVQTGFAKEREQFARIADSEDVREGVTAFLEKRLPQFKDK